MNLRPLPPQGSALPAAPHPDTHSLSQMRDILYHEDWEMSIGFAVFLKVFLKVFAIFWEFVAGEWLKKRRGRRRKGKAERKKLLVEGEPSTEVLSLRGGRAKQSPMPRGGSWGDGFGAKSEA